VAFHTQGQKENGATLNAPNNTMTKFTTSLVASVVFLMTIAVPPVRADELATGETFSIALIGIPETHVQGQPFSVTVAIHVFADGTNSPKPVSIRTWIETPLGRGILSSRTRMLMPGTTTRMSVTFVHIVNRAAPRPTEGQPPVPVTFGVTAKLKREILDVSATTLIISGSAPA
jgi:hypothetical protein